MKTRLLAVTALLLLVPLAFWLSGWHWQGNEVPLNYLLYLVTQTSSNPVVFASIAVLFALLYATQVGKSLLKPLIGEARPYVVILTKDDPARIRDFYAAKRSVRADAVRAYYAKTASPAPSHLIAHRAKETGYSFPSGHSTFAASWALLFAGIIGFANRRRSLITGAVITWAMLVMASRVWLGMHYPIDLVGGVLLAGAINLPLLHAWQQRHSAPRLQRLLKRLPAWRK